MLRAAPGSQRGAWRVPCLCARAPGKRATDPQRYEGGSRGHGNGKLAREKTSDT